MKLSIDPSGLWSIRQAQAVLAIIQPEAKAIGLSFEAVDVTTFGMPASRYILTPLCREHGYPFPSESSCDVCMGLMSGWPR